MPDLRAVNLCYVINNRDEILLQYKRKGFGVGKWNGPGGKVEPEETLEQSVIREVKEETGLDIKNLKKMAELEFYFINKEEWNQIAHVYVTKDFTGDIQVSEEGELKWFKINEIPYDKMWDDDPYWLPNILAGEFMKIKFYFDQNSNLQKYEKL
ncbi:MAG: 8-oxo-dGTP diphosphatase [Patescibacteria group bacterium]|jgi:8-oxo-dGTP diphosphatase